MKEMRLGSKRFKNMVFKHWSREIPFAATSAFSPCIFLLLFLLLRMIESLISIYNSSYHLSVKKRQLSILMWSVALSPLTKHGF